MAVPADTCWHIPPHTTGYTDGYAYSTFQVMRDAGPGGSNVSNDDCKSLGVTMTVSRRSNSESSE